MRRKKVGDRNDRLRDSALAPARLRQRRAASNEISLLLKTKVIMREAG